MKQLTRIIIRFPWAVLAAASVVLIASAIYGTGLFVHLRQGGFEDPQASSTKAANTLVSQFEQQQFGLIVLFSSSLTVNSPEYKAEVLQRLSDVSRHAHVRNVVSYYSTGQPDFVSRDGHKTYAGVALSGSETEREQVYRDVAAMQSLPHAQILLGGPAAINAQINEQIKKDLTFAETLSFSFLAILLLLVFRSAVAAGLPLVVGGVGILVAFLLVRLLTLVTDVSVYAINVITLMGLGLAVDYSLFIVSRFREELHRGAAVAEALEKTMATAGKTVLFSGTTVILCLLGLLVFPQTFLKSMGIGGSMAVVAAMALAVTVLPALLRLLGRRIDSLAMPLVGQGLQKNVVHGWWYRFTHGTMRASWLVALGATALLLLLGLPFWHAKFSTADVTAVPKAYSSRQVDATLNSDFNGGGSQPITVVVQTFGDPLSAANIQAVRQYVQDLQRVHGVQRIDALPDTEQLKNLAAEQASAMLHAPMAASLTQRYVAAPYELINIYQENAPQSEAAQQLVKNLRTVSVPPGLTVNIGGESARLVDLLDSLRVHLPYAAIIILVITSVILFVMLGSVILPLKAVILNALSLLAIFGILVWVFQDRHLSWLHFSANGTIDATQPILIFAIAFGLAMDYELFLLSRVKEAYDQTGSNREAVAIGVQKTASIITSAALLLLVVIGLFATSKISLLQQIGVGLGLGVVIDATIVRLLLVPATMTLLGEWNWWAPKWLSRLGRLRHE